MGKSARRSRLIRARPRVSKRSSANFDRSGPFGSTTYHGTPGEEGYRQETTLPPLEQARIDFSRALAMPALFGVGNQMAQFQPAGGFGNFIRPQANPYAGMQQMLGGMMGQPQMGQPGGARMPGGGGMGPGGTPGFNPYGGGFGGGKGGMLGRMFGGGGRRPPMQMYGGQPMPGGMPGQHQPPMMGGGPPGAPIGGLRARPRHLRQRWLVRRR